MKVLGIDHLVITTADIDSCLEFYVGLLGMEHRVVRGHHNLCFGSGKISVHTRKGEFLPAASNPQYGSQDFCLIVDDLQKAKAEMEERGYRFAGGIVARSGAEGSMRSLYLHDPDGNLVELSEYK